VAAFCTLALAGGASALLAAGRAVPTTTRATTTSASTTVTYVTAPGATTAAALVAPATPTTTATLAATAAAKTTTRPATTPGPAAAAATATTAAATTTTAVAPPPALTTSTAPDTVVFSGHGWGHGIGMSQWGAYGYALHGSTYDAILAHYYSGTTLGPARPVTVRVLLVENAKRVTVASDAPWRVADARGTTVQLPRGALALTPALAVRGQQLLSPLTFSPGIAPVRLAGKPYRGKLTVISAAGKLQVVNALALDSYVRGVVSSEVPSTWPAEALKAQAVAARSYAVASLTTVVTAANYDVFADTRSQVYGGLAAETDATNAAVQQTPRQVVLYDGKIATTYYSSSSGGRTVSAAEAWGKPIPYLVSVPDPYDTYAPHHNWGPVLYDAAKVAKALKLPGRLLDLRTSPGPSKHVQKVTAIGDRSQLELTGTALRFGLGLRSTWFTVGRLALTPVPAPMSYGGAATLSGTARGLRDVVLEGKPAGGEWQPVTTVRPGLNGGFATIVRPDVTTQYRLTAGDLHAALVKVAVTPLVEATVGADAAQGTVRPAFPGSPVQLQLQAGSAWTTVATGTTDAAGAFAVNAPLAPGSYRVRSAPGHGLSPGVSGALLVP
jgi:stage II sporulation protein D